jgi:arylsulfatase A-like enzyme
MSLPGSVDAALRRHCAGGSMPRKPDTSGRNDGDDAAGRTGETNVAASSPFAPRSHRRRRRHARFGDRGPRRRPGRQTEHRFHPGGRPRLLGFLPDFSPIKSGYDHFYGIFGGAADYFNHGADASRSGAEAARLYEEEVPVERHGYMTNLLGDRAVQTIEGYAGSKQPFLLSLHFTAPHWPWEGPDDEAESKRIRNIMHRDGGTQKTYGRMVQSLDANIGRVLQALDVHGLSENTIVVFTSDNGGERFSKTWPFTGMKQELLEGGLRVPAIARMPGHIAAGSVSDQAMITMDWAPTLLAIGGTRPDPAYPSDGEDLAPALTGAAAHPRKFYWRYKAGSQRAIRDADWKYLRIAGNEFLFDVVQDPRERANLKERYSDVFDRLKGDWEAWNATMLEERPRPAAYAQPGNVMADHYGVVNPPVAPPQGALQR